VFSLSCERDLSEAFRDIKDIVPGERRSSEGGGRKAEMWEDARMVNGMRNARSMEKKRKDYANLLERVTILHLEYLFYRKRVKDVEEK